MILRSQMRRSAQHSDEEAVYARVWLMRCKANRCSIKLLAQNRWSIGRVRARCGLVIDIMVFRPWLIIGWDIVLCGLWVVFRPWLAQAFARGSPHSCRAATPFERWLHGGLYVRQAARVSAPAYQLRYERVLPLCVRASPLFASATNVTSGAKTPRTLLELSRGVWGERASVPSNTSQYGHSLQPTTRGHAPVNL